MQDMRKEYALALYIRSDEVNDLADELVRLTGQKKTAAVKQALLDAIEQVKQTPTFTEKLAALQARVKEKGYCRMPDEKQFLDGMWGGI